MNNVVLIGNLAGDPELRYTNSGTPVVNFRLAVNNPYGNGDNGDDVDFINCEAWQKTAENVSQYLSKGNKAAVEGRIKVQKNKKGDRTYTNVTVNARRVEFLTPKSSNGSSGHGGNTGNQQPAGRPSTEPEVEDTPF